jgi:hypothetical protein
MRVKGKGLKRRELGGAAIGQRTRAKNRAVCYLFSLDTFAIRIR